MIHTGAVAVLDALGFKGIWNRWDPGDVVSKLLDTRDLVAREQWSFPDELLPLDGGDRAFHQRRLLFLSDTIVIASSVEPIQGVDCTDRMRRSYRKFAIRDVCRTVAGLQSWFLTGGGRPPLAYRGAIAWGQYTIEESILIGPATDEAAEAEKFAEGALVWFCPSALAVLDEVLAGTLEPGYQSLSLPIHRSWRVPMKEGRVYETAVVRPYGFTTDLLKGLYQSFFEHRSTQPIDVHIKYQNTRDFLSASVEIPPRDPFSE